MSLLGSITAPVARGERTMNMSAPWTRSHASHVIANEDVPVADRGGDVVRSTTCAPGGDSGSGALGASDSAALGASRKGSSVTGPMHLRVWSGGGKYELSGCQSGWDEGTNANMAPLTSR